LGVTICAVAWLWITVVHEEMHAAGALEKRAQPPVVETDTTGGETVG
jgi:hypothetical protein